MMQNAVNKSLLLLLGLAAQGRIGIAQSADSVTPTGNMTTRRISHTATLLEDGAVLIAGGNLIESSRPPVFKTQSSAELYDPDTGTFRPTGSMMTPRSRHTATLLMDGRVLVAGGDVENPTDERAPLALATAELYDPIARSFASTGSMTTARATHTATLLRDGRVLIAGGAADWTSAEVYDPGTGLFAATGDMNRFFAQNATLLSTGNVLVAKSDPYGPSPYVTTAELYDPSAGKFTFAGYMAGMHNGGLATLLINGRVLFTGGDVGDGDGSSWAAELYDPSSAAFYSAGAMTIGREAHSATLLGDGSVFLAGAHDRPQNAVTTELYDPATGTFRPAASLDSPRELHTATLLKDGTVLIAGGLDLRYWPDDSEDATLSSAEIYHPSTLVPPPELLPVSGDGEQGAILHAGTPRVVSSSDPALAGEPLEIYCTGLADGGAVPPMVGIGGRAADVLYFGKSGNGAVDQINVRVPRGVAPGPAVSVRLNYLGRPSNQKVTIGVE